MPIGTLTKKIQRQLRCWRIRPPSTGPRIGPSSIGAPTTLITRPIRCGPAAWTRIVIPAGMIIPPPRPWRTRKKISDPADQARPDSTEPATNSADDHHPQPLGAESLRGPAGHRDHHRERHQVTAGDPLDRRQRGVQVAAERGERDVDDRRVEDRHDRADHDDRRDHDDLPVELLGRLCHLCTKLPARVRTAANVPGEVEPFDAEVVVRRTRYASEETGWAVIDAADADGEPVVLVGPLDPPRGARAGAHHRNVGRRLPLRTTGEGRPSGAAAPGGRRDGRDLPAPCQAHRREAGGDSDRAARRRRRARRDRPRPGRRVRRRGPHAPPGAGGSGVVGGATSHAPAAHAARAARARVPGQANPYRVRRRRPPDRARAPLRADERVRRRVSDRRPDRPGRRNRSRPRRPRPRRPAAHAQRGRARRQHLPADGDTARHAARAARRRRGAPRVRRRARRPG